MVGILKRLESLEKRLPRVPENPTVIHVLLDTCTRPDRCEHVLAAQASWDGRSPTIMVTPRCRDCEHLGKA